MNAVTPKIGLQHHRLAFILALMGGALGIVGAFFQELRTGGSFLLVLIGAPVIEKGVKPTGIYLLLAR